MRSSMKINLRELKKRGCCAEGLDWVRQQKKRDVESLYFKAMEECKRKYVAWFLDHYREASVHRAVIEECFYELLGPRMVDIALKYVHRKGMNLWEFRRFRNLETHIRRWLLLYEVWLESGEYGFLSELYCVLMSRGLTVYREGEFDEKFDEK